MKNDNRLRIRSVSGKTGVLAAIIIGLTPVLMGAGGSSAAGRVTFTDIAANDSNGISYRRTPSKSNVIWEALKQNDVYAPSDVPLTPTKPRGDPGVAIFDYDGDGDLDVYVYVTNGPGTPNGLYRNQYKQTGKVSFIKEGI